MWCWCVLAADAGCVGGGIYPPARRRPAARPPGPSLRRRGNAPQPPLEPPPLRRPAQDIERCQKLSPGALSAELNVAVAKPGLLQQLQAKASSAADVLMATDAPLLFPPAQLALAALRSACRHLGLSLSSYIHHVAAQQQAQGQGQGQGQQQAQQQGDGADARAQLLLAALDRLDAFGKAGSQKPPEEQLRGINKRARRCWQLAAAAAAGRAAAADAEREQRREGKVRERADAREAAEQRLLGGSDGGAAGEGAGASEGA
jgi:hypothetical protein